MTNDEVIKELSILLQLKNIEWHGKEKQAVVYAVETLKRIDAEKIRTVLADNCECYPADEYKMSEAIVNYLRGNDEI